MRTSSRPARARSLIPLGGDGGEVGARLLADDDPGVVRHAADPRQHRLGGGCQRHHAGAGLAVAQAKLACGAVHIVPAQREDLVQAAAGEHEEAERGDGVGGDRALSSRPRPPPPPAPGLSAGTPRGRGSARAFALCICGRRGRGWCRPARGPRRRRARTSWRGPPAPGWRHGVSRGGDNAAPRRGRARPGQAASCRAPAGCGSRASPGRCLRCAHCSSVRRGRSCSARRGRRRWCRPGAGALPGSSPRLMRSMTWAARLRAWVAVISPWVPSVTRRGPPPARLWTT